MDLHQRFDKPGRSRPVVVDENRRSSQMARGRLALRWIFSAQQLLEMVPVMEEIEMRSYRTPLIVSFYRVKETS